MKCDERLEALLNRAGQTISDLPKGYLLTSKDGKNLSDVACQWFIDEDAPEGVALRNIVSIPLYQYILHLTDIIDRLEWALENVCGERDYLRKAIEKEIPCLICVATKRRAVDEPCNSCLLLPGGETMVNYEYEGVPEDWRADDD